MTGLLARCGERLRRLWHAATRRMVLRPWILAGTVAEGDEVPDLIPVRRAFLVGAPSNWKWLVFDCPCGAGHRIVLNLDRGRAPYWTLRLSRRRRITIHPSIDYRGRNGSCHYFIRNGRVVWARGFRHQITFSRRPTI